LEHSDDNINVKWRTCISTKRNNDTDAFDEPEHHSGPIRALV